MRGYVSLLRRADFARVTRQGNRHGGRHLTCFILGGRDQTRVGLTISARVGGAVVRNRVRRRLRAILDRYVLAERPARDILFIARPGAGELTFNELVGEVERTFGPLP